MYRDASSVEEPVTRIQLTQVSCSDGCHRLFWQRLNHQPMGENDTHLDKCGQGRPRSVLFLLTAHKPGWPGRRTLFYCPPIRVQLVCTGCAAAQPVQTSCILIGPHLKMAAAVLRIDQLNLRLIQRPRCDASRYINRMKYASEPDHESLCGKLLD